MQLFSYWHTRTCLSSFKIIKSMLLHFYFGSSLTSIHSPIAQAQYIIDTLNNGNGARSIIKRVCFFFIYWRKNVECMENRVPLETNRIKYAWWMFWLKLLLLMQFHVYTALKQNHETPEKGTCFALYWTTILHHIHVKEMWKLGKIVNNRNQTQIPSSHCCFLSLQRMQFVNV